MTEPEREVMIQKHATALVTAMSEATRNGKRITPVIEAGFKKLLDEFELRNKYPDKVKKEK